MNLNIFSGCFVPNESLFNASQERLIPNSARSTFPLLKADKDETENVLERILNELTPFEQVSISLTSKRMKNLIRKVHSKKKIKHHIVLSLFGHHKEVSILPEGVPNPRWPFVLDLNNDTQKLRKAPENITCSSWESSALLLGSDIPDSQCIRFQCEDVFLAAKVFFAHLQDIFDDPVKQLSIGLEMEANKLVEMMDYSKMVKMNEYDYWFDDEKDRSLSFVLKSQGPCDSLFLNGSASSEYKYPLENLVIKDSLTVENAHFVKIEQIFHITANNIHLYGVNFQIFDIKILLETIRTGAFKPKWEYIIMKLKQWLKIDSIFEGEQFADFKIADDITEDPNTKLYRYDGPGLDGITKKCIIAYFIPNTDNTFVGVYGRKYFNDVVFIRFFPSVRNILDQLNK